MANMLSATELRKGTVFGEGSAVQLVLDYKHIKMGRTPATIRVKVKNLLSGNITEMTFGSNDKVQEADTSKRNAQYLYSDEESVYFMDTDDFSQFEMPLSDLEHSIGFLKEGERVVTLYLGDKPITVELPRAVSLKVEFAPDAVAGDTSNSPMKKVRLETGIEIDAPLFIKSGEIIRINTDSGEYLGRA